MENKFQDILRKGVSFWNEWRKGNPTIVPDLSGVNLSKQNLSRINLSKANLSGSILSEAILYESDLRGARLTDSDLRAVNMSKALLNNAHLGKANLSQAFLVDAKLENCYLRHAILTKANLFGAVFAAADMQECDLREAILYQVSFNKTDLTGANFTRANLKEVDLAEAILERAYLSQAILERAVLRKSCLDKANLYKGDLRHADLLEASLSETVLFQSDFEGANLEGANLKAANLQESNLKDTIIFRTNLTEANLSRSSVSGGPFRKLITEATVQNDLNIINTWGYKIATDSLAAAQRVHSLLHNPSAAQLIPDIGTASTLVLGINAEATVANIARTAEAVRSNNALPVQIALPPFLPDNLSEFLRLLANKVDYIIFDVSAGNEALRSLNFLLTEMTQGAILPICLTDSANMDELPESGLLQPLLVFDENEDLAVRLEESLFSSDSKKKDSPADPSANGSVSATTVVEEPIDVQTPPEDKPEGPKKPTIKETKSASKAAANRSKEQVVATPVDSPAAPIAASLETEDAAATTTIEELADALDNGLAKELEADLREMTAELSADPAVAPEQPAIAEEAEAPATSKTENEAAPEQDPAENSDTPVSEPEAAKADDGTESDAEPIEDAETNAPADADDAGKETAGDASEIEDDSSPSAQEEVVAPAPSQNGKPRAADAPATLEKENETQSPDKTESEEPPADLNGASEKGSKSKSRKRGRRKKDKTDTSKAEAANKSSSDTSDKGDTEEPSEVNRTNENSGNGRGRRKKRRGKRNKAASSEDEKDHKPQKRLGDGKEPKLPGLEKLLEKEEGAKQQAVEQHSNGHSHLEKPVEIVIDAEGEEPVEFPKKRSRMRMLFTLLILLIIVAGLFAAWHFSHTEFIVKIPKTARSYVYLNDRLLLPTSEEHDTDIYHVKNLMIGDYDLKIYPTQLRDIKKMEFTRYKQFSRSLSLTRSGDIQELEVDLDPLYSVRQVAEGIHPYLHPNGEEIAYYRIERNQQGAIINQVLLTKRLDGGEEREIRVKGRNFYRAEWGKPVFEADSRDLYLTAAGSRFTYPYRINMESGASRLIPKRLQFETNTLLPMGDQDNFLVEGGLYNGSGKLVSEMSHLSAFRNTFFPVTNSGFLFLTEDKATEGGKVLHLNCNYYDIASETSKPLFQIFKSVNPPFISASENAERVIISEYSGATLYYFTQLKLWQDGRWANLTTPILDGNEAIQPGGGRHKIEAVTNEKGDRIIYEYNGKIFLLEIPTTTTLDDLVSANLEK